MCNIINSHDKFFKRTFGDINVVRDFINNYFPQNLKHQIDLKDMSLVQTECISERLEKSQADMIYKTKYDNHDAYLYFLIEHKSYISYKISLQLLKYLASFWEMMWRQEENRDRKNGRSKLPVIIPILFYHGKREWTIGEKLTDLLEDFSDDIAEYIPDFKYILYDFSPESKWDIKGAEKLKLFLKLLRYVNTREMEMQMNQIFYLMKRVEMTEDGVEFVKTSFEYWLKTDNVIKLEDLKERSKKIIPERSEDIMTIAEELLERGEKKGIRKVIYRQLNIKFGSVPEEYRIKIDNLDEERLELIAEKILKIDRIEDLEQYIE